mmetsp:Transcript_11349/g.52699  ORF Transcript_11349/g.52699 Transcript_11349/m.52699 type:complete len:268 (+) Transcript_11349:234-1037(+)
MTIRKACYAVAGARRALTRFASGWARYRRSASGSAATASAPRLANPSRRERLPRSSPPPPPRSTTRTFTCPTARMFTLGGKRMTTATRTIRTRRNPRRRRRMTTTTIFTSRRCPSGDPNAGKLLRPPKPSTTRPPPTPSHPSSRELWVVRVWVRCPSPRRRGPASAKTKSASSPRIRWWLAPPRSRCSACGTPRNKLSRCSKSGKPRMSSTTSGSPTIPSRPSWQTPPSATGSPRNNISRSTCSYRFASSRGDTARTSWRANGTRWR